jgi:hypothetical protein
MPEEINVEFSHKLSEQEEGDEKRKARWEVLIEIVEVAVLAIVAIATAWSGYQAARWDGQQSLLYGQATADRFEADAASTYGGQELSADSAMFTAYLQARSAGDSKLEMIYIRRFTPDYRVAFAAWLKTEPFTNPAAPPGPGYMPQYRNPSFESAAQLNTLASTTFDQGTAARDTAERYVRDTVLFASVLFLIAIAQRFKVRSVRVATTAVAFVLAAYTSFAVAILPRILSRLAGEDVEGVPVLRAAEGRPVSFGLLQAENVQAVEQRFDLIPGVEGHVRVTGPGVMGTEELAGEDPAGGNRPADPRPQGRELLRSAERQAAAGMDQVSGRQVRLSERRAHNPDRCGGRGRDPCPEQGQPGWLGVDRQH